MDIFSGTTGLCGCIFYLIPYFEVRLHVIQTGSMLNVFMMTVKGLNNKNILLLLIQVHLLSILLFVFSQHHLLLILF